MGLDGWWLGEQSNTFIFVAHQWGSTEEKKMLWILPALIKSTLLVKLDVLYVFKG